MIPTLLLALAVDPWTYYEGIPYTVLCDIVEQSDLRTDHRLAVLREWDAFSSKSFPLYLRLMTTDEDDPSVPSSERWSRLQMRAFGFVKRCDGDKSAFVRVGIDLLSHPKRRFSSEIMLSEIATEKDAPAVARVLDPDDAAKLWPSVSAAGVLSLIGQAEDLPPIEKLIQSKHAQADKEALRQLVQSRDQLKKRLDEKATPPKKDEKK